MSVAWLHRLELRLRHLVPLATAVLAVMIDVLPLPGPGIEGLSLFSTLGVVYFWSLYRPDLFTPGAAFLVGLLHDALTGLPPGATSLVLLLVSGLIVAQQRFFLPRPFPVIWACFMLLAPVAIVLRWAIVSLWWTHAFALPPVLVELSLTVVAYPVISLLLSHVHNRIPGLAHAS
jgi:rod shape-determining protein MreD